MKRRGARSRKEAYDLGMMYFKQGNRSKANKAWIKAVDVTPTMAWNLIKVSVRCRNARVGVLSGYQWNSCVHAFHLRLSRVKA